MHPDGSETLQDPSEDALLLRELRHRTAGEVAVVLATLVLIRSYGPPGARERLIEQAIGRLHGFGELNRLLSRPMPRRLDLGPRISDICMALGSGRTGAGASRIDLDLGPAFMEGSAARRLLLVAADLVGESVRNALQERAGRLRVMLDAEGDMVSLVVEDDGPGPRLLTAVGDGSDGRPIVVDLISRAAGTMTLVTGRRGTRVTVTVPTGMASDDDVFPNYGY